MSRSNKQSDIKNPARRFFQWEGDSGRIKYFDKSIGEKGENVYIDLPFPFLVLDVLVTMTGFYEKENSGFWSNEIPRNGLKTHKLCVRTKSGIHAEDYYANLADVKNKGAKYTQSVYIAYYEGTGDAKELVIGNIKFVGSSLSAWIDVTKDIQDIEAGRFAITKRSEEKKKGKTVYYEPVFKHTAKVPKDAEEKALELDRQLQTYLKAYFEAQGANRQSNGNGHSSDYTGNGVVDDYQRERDLLLQEGELHPNAPTNPIAKSLNDLITGKQLGMINALAKEKGLDMNEECQEVFQCRVDNLSKKAASKFIEHLQELEVEAVGVGGKSDIAPLFDDEDDDSEIPFG